VTSTRWPLVYHDGHLVMQDKATLPVASIALRFAMSVFEGIRVYPQADGGVRPWLLDQHVDRLRDSCRLTALDERVCDAVPAVVAELLAANQVDEDAYVRVSASAGNVGGIGDDAETVLTVSVAPSPRRKWLATGAGMRIAVGPWQRPPAAAFPSAARNISAYAGPRLALREAGRTGYDTTVLLTHDGLVSEAPTATVVLVEQGGLVTPRLSDAVQPGLTRAWVLAAARSMDLHAEEDAVSPERLRAADEVFLCGTGLEFGPVREVDGVELSGWPYCPVTTALVDEYFRQARGETEPVKVDWMAT
jgi:branched-chain amino acid aminotransferase